MRSMLYIVPMMPTDFLYFKDTF